MGSQIKALYVLSISMFLIAIANGLTIKIDAETCTDCLGADQIQDIYVLNTGDNITALSISTLTNCDTLDTDDVGTIICGTDASGGGGANLTDVLAIGNTAGIYNIDMEGNSIINVNNLNLTYVTGTDIAMNWGNISNYATTCTASQYISALGDTNTCAAISITESQISNLAHRAAGIGLNLSTNTLNVGLFGISNPMIQYSAVNNSQILDETVLPEDLNLAVNQTFVNLDGDTITGPLSFGSTYILGDNLNLAFDNLTSYAAGCTNQFMTGLADTNLPCNSVTNSYLTSGIFSSITGIGTQAQNLDMNSYVIENIGNSTTKFIAGGHLNLSGNLTIIELRNCDTIDTDGDGRLVCGTDASGGGGANLTDVLAIGNTAGIYNIDMEGNSIINVNNLNLTYVTGTDIAMNWGNISNYATTCTASQYISALGDTNTCAAISITESQISDFKSYLIDTGDTATGNYTFDDPTFAIDSDTNRVGVGTNNPETQLHVVGNITVTERTCYNGCSVYIEYNGSQLILQG